MSAVGLAAAPRRPEEERTEEGGSLPPSAGVAASLTHRAYLNVVASLLDYTAKTLVGLLLTPVLVAGLGRSLFGVWEILGRTVGYLAAADGRPTEALRLVIANQQNSADDAIKRQQVGSAVGVWLAFSPLLLIVGAIAVWLSPELTRSPPELRRLVQYTCALLVVNFVLGNLVALPEAVLRGMNLGYRRMGLQAALNVAGGVLSLLAIRLRWSLPGLAAAQIVLTLLTGLLFWQVVRKYVSWWGLSPPTLAGLRTFLRLSVWSFLGALIARVLVSSDVIILGLFSSAATVTTYVLTGYCGQALTGITTLALMALAPGLGGIIGARHYERAAVVRQELLTLTWVVVCAVGSTVLVWNRSFLHLWVGDQHYAGSWVNLLVVLMMVQTVFIRADTHVIDAMLRLRDRVFVGGVAAVVSIVLAVVLTPARGIVGLCMSVIVGRLVQTIAYPLMARSCLGEPGASRTCDVVRMGITGILLFGLALQLGTVWLARNWLEWIVCSGSTFAVALGIAGGFGLPPRSRTMLIRRLDVVRTSLRPR